MEEIVNRFTSELDASLKEFTRQAHEIATWDRVLLHGGDEIAKVTKELVAAEEQQMRIEQSLDYIETEQKELGDMLDSYDAQIGAMLKDAGTQGWNVSSLSRRTNGIETGAADSERDRAYGLAESLNAHLDETARNLRSMIEEVNELTSPATANGSARSGDNRLGQAEDPVAQIVGILNAHLTSLKWIDDTSVSLRAKLEDLRRGQTPQPLSRSGTQSLRASQRY